MVLKVKLPLSLLVTFFQFQSFIPLCLPSLIPTISLTEVIQYNPALYRYHYFFKPTSPVYTVYGPIVTQHYVL